MKNYKENPVSENCSEPIANAGNDHDNRDNVSLSMTLADSKLYIQQIRIKLCD